MYFQGPNNSTLNWEEHKSAEGIIYYHNLTTNQTSYEKPDELKTPTERLLSQSHWKEYKTNENKSYYYNSVTKESVWSIPKELEELKSKLDLENDKAIVNESNEESNVAINLNEDSNQASSLEETPISNQNEDSKSSTDVTPIINSKSPKESNPQDQQIKDNKLLVDTFYELMRDKNITSTASWEFALKSISTDPRYELFRHLNKQKRKQMFNSYKIQKAKDEREEQRMKAKRARENLDKYLQSSPLVNPNLRYRQAVDLFRENEYWKAVPESDRREIFEDVVKYLGEKEKKDAENLRRRNMTVLADILDSMPTINHRTGWADAQQLLIDNPAFANNSDLLNMDKEDALVIFTEHIRQLEQDEEEEKRNEKKRLLRQKRKNRERFEELMDELREQGKLSSISKWCNLYQEISADPRFHAMLTNFSGSTPLDLFKFYVDNLKRRYEEDKQIIKSILKEHQFHVNCTTNFEDFLEVLKEDDRALKSDSNNVKMVFEKLFDRAKESEKERLRELNKSRRKLELQFVSALSRIDPPIDENTNWADVRFKIENEDIFNEFNETERIKLFKSYIHSLEESCSHHHSKSRKQKKLKRSKHVHSSSSSISSDNMELEQRDEESNEYESNIKKVKHHHHKSRSNSDSTSSNHRQSRSQSPSFYRKRHRHLDEVSDDNVTEDMEADNLNQDDLEDLERQREILLSKLAAHD